MQNSVLFGILMSLLARPRTGGELAEKYELSLRSVYRYLDTLEAAGVPLLRKIGAAGGFAIDSTHFIDKAYFTDAEYRYLADLTAGAELGSEVEREVADKIAALARLNRARDYNLSPANLVIDADSWTEGESKVKRIHAAIERRTAIEIVYADGDLNRTQRVVEPHTLVFKQSAWYVYAYCRLRGDWRLFALGRIVSINETDEIFERRNYDPAQASWRTLSTDDTAEVTLTFSPAVAHLVADWLGERNVDGTAATARLPLNRATVSRLLSFGADVEVLAPSALRDEMSRTLAAAAQRYR